MGIFYSIYRKVTYKIHATFFKLDNNFALKHKLKTATCKKPPYIKLKDKSRNLTQFIVNEICISNYS